MAHIPKLFGTVISFLVICSSCEKVSSSDNNEVEAPKILYDSDERYFYVKAVRDVNLAKSLWVNMDSEEKADFSIVFQPAYDTQRGPTRRYLKWLKLSFDFPFYGYLTKFVSIDIDGRICMKKIKYYNEECNSFVAPLGTKLSFRKNESYIKYKDTGKSFIVQWGNVDLNPPFYYVKLNVTVQATLYENGTIEFVYKQILSSLFVVYGDEFKTRVTIDTRDSKGYIGNHDHPYGSIALQERMNKDHFDIKNGTVILMTPLPTCNSFTSCHLCALSRTNFQCVWCPQLNRCTNYGMDRGYQKWVSSGCINNHISSFEYAGKCLDKRRNWAFEVVRRAKKMANIRKLFRIFVISILVKCSSCDIDDIEDEPPKLLFNSDDSFFLVHAVRDAKLAKSLWVNMDSVKKTYFDRERQPAYDEHLAPTRRYLESVKLSFPFPFYGYNTDSITVDIDGKICMKKVIDFIEECHSFVAPLATKLSFHKDESYIKYKDTGKSFVVQWGNVDLYPPSGYLEQNVTMQVTLYENGTIEFVYKQISSSVFALLQDGLINELSIGTSDTSMYIILTNFPYGVVALRGRISKDIDIKNGTVIIMSPLPTCLSYTSCESCVLSETDFMCAWCPQLNRCSNYGIDRGFRDWYSHGCHNNPISDVKQCLIGWKK
ncbi:Hypothetical predicted protein [Cloeon dipterum]|uniref:PSI domain-containing protein n=1 Tax=Cloeon dipterum TaxID=197152 RepID=A0A8S1CYQ1_9INSE|nr:Hypothetical predicted protein [Cloeon dipterum]